MSADKTVCGLAATMIAPCLFLACVSWAEQLGGSVQDADSLKPLAYANVVVLGEPLGTQVKEDGTFVLEGLADGEYAIQASFVGYEPRRVKVTIPGDSKVRFLLERQGSGIRRSFADSIGCAAPKEVMLECEITSAQPYYRVGERPDFRIQIRNKGDSEVLLPLSVDGSTRAARFPVVQVEFSGGVSVQDAIYCANTNPLLEGDFVKLEPGAEVDPYSGGWIPRVLREGVFAQIGTYKVTFYYSTDEGDVTLWLGFGHGTLADGVATRLKRTPRVVLECAVEVEVID